MKERICRIYTLAHPVTGEIRYVGKTVDTLHRRLIKHVTDSKKRKSRCANWIKSISKLSLKPIIEEIDNVPNSIYEETGKYWIAQFKAWGFNLTNHTEGGEGSTGFKHSEKSRKIISEKAKGRQMNKAVNERLKEINKGNTYKLGKPDSEETKKRKSLAKSGSISITPVINTLTGIRYHTIKQAALANDIDPQTLGRRIRAGKTEYQYDSITEEDIEYIINKKGRTRKKK